MNKYFTLSSTNVLSVHSKGRVKLVLSRGDQNSGMAAVESQSDSFFIELKEDNGVATLVVNDTESMQRQRDRLETLVGAVKLKEGFWGAVKSVIHEATSIQRKVKDSETALISVTLPLATNEFRCDAENAEILSEKFDIDRVSIKANNLHCQWIKAAAIGSLNIEANNLHLEFAVNENTKKAAIRSNKAKIHVLCGPGFNGGFKIKSNISKIEGSLRVDDKSDRVSITANNLKLRATSARENQSQT